MIVPVMMLLVGSPPLQECLWLHRSAERDDFDKLPQDLQDDDAGERAEEAVDALERAAMFCDDAISACEEALARSIADEMREEHRRRVLGE
jgi:hypothetical protein